MAEFTAVMRQAKRMCAAHGGMCISRNCPLDNGEACRLAADQDGEDCSDVERIIMAWAAEHPEPMYPSWADLWQSLFPGADNPCPKEWFGEDCPKGMECFECIERPMSKKVAEKLGIKPITTEKVVPEHDGCEGCRWMDKHEDEEPCCRCSGVNGGSAPDLWEEE